MWLNKLSQAFGRFGVQLKETDAKSDNMKHQAGKGKGTGVALV